MGNYAAQSDLEQIFGAQNIRRWSQLDNTSTTVDTDRVAWAIAVAEAEIDDRFRDSEYTLPFSPAPRMVTDWAARKAGLLLFDSRGEPVDGDPYKFMRDAMEQQIAAYQQNARRFDASRKQVQARVPWAPGGGS